MIAIRRRRCGALVTEAGPTRDVTLQSATYFDGADQAGISRIFGGIHIRADDFAGRRIGSSCGRDAWTLAQGYLEGNAPGEAGWLRQCRIRGLGAPLVEVGIGLQHHHHQLDRGGAVVAVGVVVVGEEQGGAARPHDVVGPVHGQDHLS